MHLIPLNFDMRRWILVLSGVAALTIITPFCSRSQHAALQVVDKHAVYAQMVEKDTAHLMIAIQQFIPGIRYQLWYSTKQNFMHRKLYPPVPNTYLRLPVAKALQQVADTLKKQGLGIIVWDAYRPYKVTLEMWKLIRDERYVSNPAKGSGHNKGIAIDLTLYDLATGKELDMGTGFDNFSDTAHHAFKDLDATIIKNRQLLKATMNSFGFSALETEWWHYSWQKASFPVLDLSFKKLRRLSKAHMAMLHQKK